MKYSTSVLHPNRSFNLQSFGFGIYLPNIIRQYIQTQFGQGKRTVPHFCRSVFSPWQNLFSFLIQSSLSASFLLISGLYFAPHYHPSLSLTILALRINRSDSCWKSHHILRNGLQYITRQEGVLTKSVEWYCIPTPSPLVSSIFILPIGLFITITPHGGTNIPEAKNNLRTLIFETPVLCDDLPNDFALIFCDSQDKYRW